MLMAAITLGIQAWSVNANNPNWQTMVFITLSLAQLGHVYSIRSNESIFSIGWLSNAPLFYTVTITFIIQLCTIYLPIGNKILKTHPLTLTELLISCSGAVLIFTAVEMEKKIRRLKLVKHL